MRLHRILLAGTLLAVVVGAAYVGQKGESVAVKMAAAAQQLVDSLSDEQKTKAMISFDDKERTNWHFVPLEDKGKPTRKGLSLENMKDAQKKLALDLLRASTSASGGKEAIQIMSLEAILRDL